MTWSRRWWWCALTLALTLALSACTKKPRRPRPGEVERLVPLSESPPSRADDDPYRIRALPPPRTHPTDAGVVTVNFITDRPPVGGALGLLWGAPRAEVLQRSRQARVECRESQEYVFCRRALVETPLPLLVTYEFCADRLCSVAVDGTRTRDERVMESEYLTLLNMVKSQLGDPTLESRRMGQGCSGHLPLCLGSRQADLRAQWVWRDGPQVELAVDQLEDDALMAQAAITWLSTERVQRREPPPPPLWTTRDGGAGRQVMVMQAPADAAVADAAR